MEILPKTTSRKQKAVVIMTDKVDKLIERIKKDDIHFIRFEAPSISGQAIGMLVPARNCEHFLRKGFPFVTLSLMQTINTSIALDGFAESGFRNISMAADIDSYKVIPWQELTKTASIMMCQPLKYDTVYPTDCRTLALRQISILNNQFNLDILSAIEHEFVLLDSSGKPISNPGCYHLDRTCKFTDFFGLVDKNLYKMGIECERMHSEVASGQYEITAFPAYNIKAADNAYWIRNGVREMAQQYKQWTASFVTHLHLSESYGGDNAEFSVVEDDSGAHFNFSLWRKTESRSRRENVFWDKTRNDLSDMALYFIGGILRHIEAITAFCCPSTICYETRFNSPWVSSFGNWGKYNRTALIRAKSSKNAHLEFRLPSSLANPYLILACVICAGCDGLNKKILPPKETSMDMVDEKEREKCFTFPLPKTLDDALVKLKDDKLFVDKFGEIFIRGYVETKEMELQEMDDAKKKKIKPLCYALL